MSVLSVDPKAGTTITTAVLDEVCNRLGVRIRDEEKEDYTKLLAVFDEGCQELMAMDGKYFHHSSPWAHMRNIN